jgi:hypothetical protein
MAIIHEGSIDGLASGGAGFIKWLGHGLGGRSMGFCGSVCWLDQFVRGMLFVERCRMVAFFECLVNIAWNGDVNVSFIVVPVKSEATVQFSGPIDDEGVVGFDGINDMHGIGFGEILDTEVVNTEDKRGAFGAVLPEALGERHGFVGGRC